MMKKYHKYTVSDTNMKFIIEPSHAKKPLMTFDVIMRKTLIKITSFFGKITSVISVHALQCTVKIYL